MGNVMAQAALVALTRESNEYLFFLMLAIAYVVVAFVLGATLLFFDADVSPLQGLIIGFCASTLAVCTREWDVTTALPRIKILFIDGKGGFEMYAFLLGAGALSGGAFLLGGLTIHHFRTSRAAAEHMKQRN